MAIINQSSPSCIQVLCLLFPRKWTAIQRKICTLARGGARTAGVDRRKTVSEYLGTLLFDDDENRQEHDKISARHTRCSNGWRLFLAALDSPRASAERTDEDDGTATIDENEIAGVGHDGGSETSIHDDEHRDDGDSGSAETIIADAQNGGYYLIRSYVRVIS